MNWEVWIVPVIAVAVWIIGSLIKGQENEKPDGRPRPRPEGGGPPRQQSPDLDKFLQEVQRRKQAAERSRQERAEGRRERPPEVRPVERRPVVPIPVAEPAPRPRPSVQVPPPAPRKPPRPTQPTPRRPAETPRPVPTSRPVEVIPVVELQPVTVIPVEPAFPAARTAPVAALGPEARDKEDRTPLQGQLAELLRSPKTMRLAFVLREILDPPLSKRRHG